MQCLVEGLKMVDPKPEGSEEKWMKRWSDEGLFLFDRKDQKKQLFVIDTPPPNTTGGLHMGHVFWTCYIDALAKYNKMKGLNVLYPVGWDEHGFPTEIEAETKYGRNLPREEFYKRCVEVSEANKNDMKKWMLKLGATFDESLEYRTTDKDYVRKVQLSLLMMHEKGMLYRAEHPIEWCVRCGSGISREQAEEKERETLLNYVDFEVSGGEGKGKKQQITIATTRPELMHAAVALAVNPTDKRYSKLIGGKAIAPIFGTEIDIIGDELVDKDFGTGAEMVCTFGDKRDINVYYRHKLRLVQAMDAKGALTNAQKFDGLHVSKAREAVIAELKKEKLLKKQEKIKQVVKVHDRCQTPIELISAVQWFLKIKDYADRIKQTAAAIKWVPEFTRQRLDDWANYIEWDWAISRNRVFGTPIPFWYCEKCDYIMPPRKEDLPFDSMSKKPYEEKCPKCDGRMVGTRDTLDGWVDTSITSMVIAGWPDDMKFYKRAFPSTMRIQGTDIIRTWAFYTIYRTWALTGNKPWEWVLAHGMVLGKGGREMHKSLGNGIYPEELIKKYPIDAIRLWVALSGGIGKDKPFSYAEMDYARSFVVKLRNTANFLKLALKERKQPKEEPHKYLNVFDIWILNRLNDVVREVTDSYDAFLLNEAMGKAINFYWHEFADYYIENVKHRVYSKEKEDEDTKAAALFTLKYVLDTSLALFAPVIPFVAEEVNSLFSEKSVFGRGMPKYMELGADSSYVINGLVQKSQIVEDASNIGRILNFIIAEARKEKAKNRLALNKEIPSMIINVPDEYISAVLDSQNELKSILKVKEIVVKKEKEFSVSIKI